MHEHSPWPFTASLGVLVLMIGIALWMHARDKITLVIGGIVVIASIAGWLKDLGHGVNDQSIKAGMLIFIASEGALFLAVFSSFIYCKLWPINPKFWELQVHSYPLGYINTLLLVISGNFANFAHDSIKQDNIVKYRKFLQITIVLGIIFVSLQMIEYMHLNISGGIYASLFYIATGIHGLHVVLGIVFFMVCIVIRNRTVFTCALWYWHFVDIVWLALFFTVYIL